MHEVAMSSDIGLKLTVDGGTDAWAVLSNGNVGIGTTSPSVKLDVRGVGNFSGDIYFNNGTAVSSLGVSGSINSTSWNRTGTNVILANTGDSVGVGVGSPAYRLEVADVDKAVNASGVLYVNGSSGNVGIGTTAPGGALHVVDSVVSNLIDDPNANIILEDDDLFLELSADDGGTWSSALILTDAFGASDSRKWHISQSTSGTGNKFGIGYQKITSSTSVGDTAWVNVQDLVIDTSGNVGIGTTSPGTNLEVAGNIWMIESGGDPELAIGDATSAGNFGVLAWDSTNDLMKLNTQAGGTQIVLDESGNVGIGTTAPFSKLHIENGSLLVNGSGDANGFFYNASLGRLGIGIRQPSTMLDVRGVGNFSGDIYFNNGTAVSSLVGSGANVWATNGTAIYNDTVSQVGIGTSSPESLLHLYKTSGIDQGLKITNTGTYGPVLELESTDTGGKKFLIASTGSSNTGGAGNLVIWDMDDAEIRMILDTDGNVGIGTTSPNSKLEVNGSGDLFKVGNGTDTFLFVNESTGRVGIGTASPSVNLDLNGNLRVSGYIVGKTDIGRLDFYGDLESSNPMTFLDSGNLGIGTTSPSKALDVRGQGNFSGTIYINNATDISSFGTGNVSGDGNTNVVPIWTGGNTLGNSSITDDGNTVIITL